MDVFSHKRVVLTLDAGGTNFVFGASQAIGLGAYAYALAKLDERKQVEV